MPKDTFLVERGEGERMRRTLKGSLTISRVHGDVRYFEIRITDDSSCVEFLTARVSPNNLAEALGGLANVDLIEYEIFQDAPLGWIAENKEEIVPCSSPYTEKGKAEAMRKVKKLEVDGWRARSGDITNHHRFTDKGVRVGFIRHVPPKATRTLAGEKVSDEKEA